MYNVSTMADDRPPRKDQVISGRASKKDIERARARAKSEGRSLWDVIRSFITGYGNNEYGTPPPLPGEGRRAKKQPRKKTPSQD